MRIVARQTHMSVTCGATANIHNPIPCVCGLPTGHGGGHLCRERSDDDPRQPCNAQWTSSDFDPGPCCPVATITCGRCGGDSGVQRLTDIPSGWHYFTHNLWPSDGPALTESQTMAKVLCPLCEFQVLVDAILQIQAVRVEA